VQALVLAGGLATRLHPKTLTCPKSLLSVAGRPFVDWQLQLLVASGFHEVILCLGHLGDQVAAHVGDGSDFGINVRYSYDGPRLLGTLGAVRKALPLLEQSFLVTYGDSYLPFDYSAPLRELEAHPEALGSMSVYKNDGRWDSSNTAIENGLVTHYQKNSKDSTLRYIDYGATALRREVVEAVPADSAIGLDALQADLSSRGLLRAFEAERRFYEIGSEQGLSELEAALASHRPFGDAAPGVGAVGTKT
jgi:N-acetyl-alpha-D-muramate 1-phosphate uridylyltransferase